MLASSPRCPQATAGAIDFDWGDNTDQLVRCMDGWRCTTARMECLERGVTEPNTTRLQTCNSVQVAAFFLFFYLDFIGSSITFVAMGEMMGIVDEKVRRGTHCSAVMVVVCVPRCRAWPDVETPGHCRFA